MAISKTLTPTNVTIQIPDFTDRPDQRANSNCIDKEADAINALNTHIASHTLLGSQNSAGVVSLSENYTNYVFVEIVAGTSGSQYCSPMVVSTEYLKTQGENDYNLAILQYIIASSSVGVCRVWHVSNTQISVRDACKIYGVIKKS